MKNRTISYHNLPKLTKDCNYQIDVGMNYLEEVLSNYRKDFNLNTTPDFQRGHIWTRKQQRLFIEYFIKGGYVSPILFNCPGWQQSQNIGDMVLVDGLQRLTALLSFINNDLKIFGGHTKDCILNIPNRYLKFAINDIESEVEVLRWYIELNSGTPHSKEELDRVLNLISSKNV